MEHPASGLKDIVHGQGLACLTPSVIEATMCPKYEDIAKIFGTDDLVQAIKDLIAKLELPVASTFFIKVMMCQSRALMPEMEVVIFWSFPSILPL